MIELTKEDKMILQREQECQAAYRAAMPQESYDPKTGKALPLAFKKPSTKLTAAEHEQLKKVKAKMGMMATREPLKMVGLTYLRADGSEARNADGSCALWVDDETESQLLYDMLDKVLTALGKDNLAKLLKKHGIK